MISIAYAEPQTPDWLEWRAKCDTVTRRLSKWPPSTKAEEQLYKSTRATIFNIYLNKCAYCEVELGASQFGDVEHFRPKGPLRNNFPS